MGSCSSDWVVGLIEDAVKIPKDLPAGDYVLSWRWDAEETAQIWANCADVVVTA
jgi:predicted carbohydrate-binding protein with CBM5 and CBM33 domain